MQERRSFSSSSAMKYMHKAKRGSRSFRFSWSSIVEGVKDRFGDPQWRKKAGKIALIALAAFVVLVAGTFAYFAKGLPDPSQLAQRDVVQSTKILARDGTLLYEVHGEVKRTVIDFKDMPDTVRQATLAAEDKDFYKHKGFSVIGILRAAFNDVFKNQSLAGGSTITQQLVKNSILSKEKSFTRKIKELILSIQIEQRFSKDEILALYLNQIPYGSNAYGIEAASQTFFGKHAKDLSLAESAYLASLPRAPTYYSPSGANTDALEGRKNHILDLMVDNGFIARDKAEEAKKVKVTFQAQRDSIKAPHFVQFVKDQLVDKYGETALEEGGYVVTTTLDPHLQDIAEQTVADGAARNDRYKASNAALVAVDPKTGQILAMVGSRDYFDKEHDGNVNVANRLRQPGSSFKPYAYAEAFIKGYAPATMLTDVKTDFGGGYSPNNYNGQQYGLVNMRIALQGSLNISAVKTLALAGVPDTINLAQSMGISTLTDSADRYGLSLVLGGAEVKLVDHVGAYGVFANGGVKQPETPFLKIEKNGKTVEEWRDQGKQVMDPQIAYLISNVLSDNNARSYVFGSHSPLTLSDRPAAAKTGTTQDFRDGWTVGYTPSLVAGVWTGNNDNSPMQAGADGVVTAGPIWNSFMKQALGGTAVEQFTRPAGIQDILVDQTSGLLPNDNTPGTKSEVFASTNAPKGQDNVHIKVRIDSVTGKLATEFTPANLVQEKTFTVIHSEKPDSANWENPVRAWAEAHGYNQLPPTEKDDVHVPQNKPTVEITAPSDGSSVTSLPLAISAKASAPRGISKVEFYIDGNLLGADTGSPFSASITSGLSHGAHTITAKAFDDVSNESDVSLSVTYTPSVSAGVLLVSPVSGDSLTFPTSLVADVASSANPDSVSFYYKGTGSAQLIGTDSSGSNSGTNKRFTFDWATKPASGSYTVYAMVTYKGGSTSKSDSIDVTVP